MGVCSVCATGKTSRFKLHRHHSPGFPSQCGCRFEAEETTLWGFQFKPLQLCANDGENRTQPKARRPIGVREPWEESGLGAEASTPSYKHPDLRSPQGAFLLRSSSWPGKGPH